MWNCSRQYAECLPPRILRTAGLTTPRCARERVRLPTIGVAISERQVLNRPAYYLPMDDVLEPEQRHRNMSNIRSSNTRPEMTVRRTLHAQGFRYRLHVRKLAGTPDIVFPSRRKVIFVNGCFWHSHSCKFGRVCPKTNAEFWATKRNRTVERDDQNRSTLETAGWNVLTVWECELTDTNELEQRLIAFLSG